jgi:hypothetical protein
VTWALPMPPALVEQLGARGTVVIGEPGDPTREDVRPAEYALSDSALYPGRSACTVLVDLDDAERARIAAGGRLLLTLDGGELPWSIDVAPEQFDRPWT